MQRYARNGLMAAAMVAVVGVVPAAGWLGGRSAAPADPPAGVAAATSQSSSPTDLPMPSMTPAPSRTATRTPTVSAKPSVRPSAKASSTPTKAPAHSAGETATPVPAAKQRTLTPTPAPFRFPVSVSVGPAHQIITVSTSGSYANVVGWQLRGSTWVAVIQTKAARVGTHGVVTGSKRQQGTGTTPTGTYTMTESFGIAANPGTRMAYHQVSADDWWVEDNNSAYYNTMRKASQGGFDTTLPSSAMNSSEHLITYTGQYQYAVVINFNRPPNAVRYRGAGIFLHVNGTGSTAGCVSVPLATMVAIMKWLDPAQNPRIAIG